jgi:general secretion pathway protein D
VSVRLTWTITVAATALLTACNNNQRPAGPSVSAASTLADLHLSTQVPPPIIAPQRAVTPAVLSQPVILKGMPPVTFGGHAAPREAGTIALNFDKASLRSVIDAILGDALGVPYSVDERVDGVVTLVSPQKIGREQALEVLDGILRLNGATLIKGDNLYRVVLAANARQALPAPRMGADNPGYAISVYVASHTAASSLQKLIEPLYQIAGSLAADPEHNLLLITGSAEERRALLDAARLFDQDWLANQSVGIYPLRHARPKSMVDELKALYGPGGAAAAEGSAIRFSAVERLNAVMVVARQGSGLDSAGDWIARLDQAGAGERTLHVYQVHYAKPQAVAKLLSRLFSSTGGVETGTSALPPGTSGSKMSTQASAPAAPAGAQPSAPPSFGSSDKAFSAEPESELADTGDSGNGPKIVPDPASHALLVMANQQEARTIEAALAQLDAKPLQILIEATIVEVTLNKNLQYGVQYFLRGTKLLEQDSSVGFNASTTAGTITGIAPGFNGVLGTLSNPSAIISALDQVTDSKVLSSPQLLVTDSKEALLKVGTQTPLLTQQAVSTLTTGAPIVSSVEYHDTGVILRVLPHSNDAGMVSLDIAQEVSDVVPSAANPLTPNIEQRRIESSVTVQSGQTVLLGGLIAENNSLGRNGTPWLSNIPLLGNLFGVQTDNRSRTELIVFITPHVLRDNDEAKALTDELLGRLTSMRPAEP